MRASFPKTTFLNTGASEPQACPHAPRRWWPHQLAVLLLSLAVSLHFLREPGFGDDLTYWSLAFDLHDIGFSAWSVRSFHDLRWPVWGVSWLWQALFGPGLFSFYCVPAFYLAAGSALAFTLGRKWLGSITAGWTCAVALLFLPMLAPVIVKLQFRAGTSRGPDFLLKPILYAGGGKDFFAVAVPSEADSCLIELRFAGKTKSVEVTAFRAYYEDAG